MAVPEGAAAITKWEWVCLCLAQQSTGKPVKEIYTFIAAVSFAYATGQGMI